MSGRINSHGSNRDQEGRVKARPEDIHQLSVQNLQGQPMLGAPIVFDEFNTLSKDKNPAFDSARRSTGWRIAMASSPAE